MIASTNSANNFNTKLLVNKEKKKALAALSKSQKIRQRSECFFLPAPCGAGCRDGPIMFYNIQKKNYSIERTPYNGSLQDTIVGHFSQSTAV
jgi:hypothetical protein